MKINEPSLYKDPAQPIEARIADLLSQMTQAEKLGQATQGHLEPGSEKAYCDALRNGELGSLLPGGVAVGDTALRNRLQEGCWLLLIDPAPGAEVPWSLLQQARPKAVVRLGDG